MNEQRPIEASSTLRPSTGLDRFSSLSPSRAGDFMTCPLLYRFRVIDRLPERPSIDAVRGTVVHKVLEDLYDRPAAERTVETATLMVDPAWEVVRQESPEVVELFESGDHDLATWLDECRRLLDTYFTLEDPTRLQPTDREVHVRHRLEDGLTLHGYIDRIDVAPTGEVRIVDYKTGRSPSTMFEAKALFQMRFYALVVWRSRGVLPTLLQLVYLGNGEVVRYEPDEDDLLATERKIHAIWQAITRAMETGDWKPRRSRLCDWCDHQSICPAWGGTPPPLPGVPARDPEPTKEA